MKLAVSRAAMAIMVLGSCALLQSGCAVGYISFHYDVPEQMLSTIQLPDIKIAYSYANPSNDYKAENTFWMGFERSLRGRFSIVDLQQIAASGTQNSERFVIDVEQKGSEIPSIDFVWGVIGFISFAIIPCVFSDHQDIIFTMRSPQGEEKRYQYRYTERSYSWLPFMFFAPGFKDYPLKTPLVYDSYQEERLKTIEDITTRFMIDAAPFIIDQHKQHMKPHQF